MIDVLIHGEACSLSYIKFGLFIIILVISMRMMMNLEVHENMLLLSNMSTYDPLQQMVMMMRMMMNLEVHENMFICGSKGTSCS